MAVIEETFGVRGFHCSGCADTLGRSLRALEGVIRAEADYVEGRVDVRRDTDRIDQSTILKQIRIAGFDPDDA